MKRVYIVRHGESEGNETGIIQGHLDYKLTSHGKYQAECLNEFLTKKIKKNYTIFSSDSKRAYQTAEIVNPGKEIIIKNKKLREMGLGEWQGMSKKDIFSNAHTKKAWFENPLDLTIKDAETFEHLRDRISNFYSDFILPCNSENIIIVSHGATICVFISFLMNTSLNDLWQYKHNNTAFTEFLLSENGKISNLKYNLTPHLKENKDTWF